MQPIANSGDGFYPSYELESGKPEVIVTANIGCQTHLDGAGRTPVRHWIEIVEEAMS